MASYKCICSSMKHAAGGVLSVNFNSSCDYVLSCGKDKTIRLWNPMTGVLINTYRGHGYEVLHADASNDSSRLASCGGDRQVFYWDVASGRYIRKFRGHHAGVVNCVKFCGANSNTGGNSGSMSSSLLGENVIASGGYDKMIHFWDCRSNNQEPIQTIDCFRDSVSTILAGGQHDPNNTANVHMNSAEIIAASVDGTIRCFDVRNGTATVDDLQQPITSLSISKDGELMLASCLTSQLVLIHKPSGTVLRCFEGHDNENNYKLMSSFVHGDNDDTIVSGSEDGSILIWNVLSHANTTSSNSHHSTTNNGRRDRIKASADICCHIRGAHGGVVTGIISHMHKDVLVSCAMDGTIKTWKKTV